MNPTVVKTLHTFLLGAVTAATDYLAGALMAHDLSAKGALHSLLIGTLSAVASRVLGMLGNLLKTEEGG